MDEAHAKAELRSWILARAKVESTRELGYDTPILEEGLLSSLDVVELVLFIESLKASEVDADSIEPESFRDIDTIYAAFLASD
jgi:acyl carrier protein